MKLTSAILAVLVVVLAAGYFDLALKISSVETALAKFAHDRDALPAELRKLNARLDELQNRAITSSSTAPASSVAAESGRVAESKPPPAASVARPGVTVTAPMGWNKNGAKADCSEEPRIRSQQVNRNRVGCRFRCGGTVSHLQICGAGVA